MNYSDKNVKCPFYKKIKETKIKCEGAFSDRCVNYFKDKDVAMDYFKKYCCADYKKCPNAKIIIKKYDFEVT